jgi:branched-chain amino acid transport system permease protein
MIAFILVGGIGTLFGPLLGAVILTWLTQSLQFLQDYRMIVFGPLLILLVMFMPSGLIGFYNEWSARRAAASAGPRRASRSTAEPTAEEARANA